MDTLTERSLRAIAVLSDPNIKFREQLSFMRHWLLMETAHRRTIKAIKKTDKHAGKLDIIEATLTFRRDLNSL